MKNIKTYEEFEEGVTFKDYLENHYKNIQTILMLDCDDTKLINLDGVEQGANLEELHCCDNELTSLDPIKNLTKLHKLRFSYNNISDLSFIEKLVNINYLCFHYNKITSLKGIENLTKLNILYCYNNPIDWIDYIDKQGRKYYIKLPKSITKLECDKFPSIKLYWYFMDKNQPASITRKFNF